MSNSPVSRVIAAMMMGAVLGGSLGPAQAEKATSPAAKASHVPKWDARGSGALAWQSVACVDMTDDGQRVAVGTFAPAGDPNVALLGGDGKLIGQFTAGLRGAEAVVVDRRGAGVLAICGTPAGTAGDRPLVMRFAAAGAPAERFDQLIGQRDTWFFHYGDHSNHLGLLLCSAGNSAVAVSGGRVLWLTGQADAGQRMPESSVHVGQVATAAAVSRDGLVVVGGAQAAAADDRGPGNLQLFEPGAKQPLWSRPINTETDRAPATEPGCYGPPAPPYRDEKVYGPLAVAIQSAGPYIAAADYQGWDRQFAAKGIRRAESYGIRFMPARPAVCVYDRTGKPVRRFDPATFSAPFWCELVFSADGKRLFVLPRSWTCRGLAGRGFLPVDAQACGLYVLDIVTGRSEHVEFPDAISSLASSADGTTVVGCWDGTVYRLDEQHAAGSAAIVPIGSAAASLVRISGDGARILAAQDNGVVRMFDRGGRQLWQTDLNRVMRPAEQTAKKQKAAAIDEGIWSANGNRAHSDMGGQYVIEAPQGLILIDPNSAHSFSQNWARIAGAGLDPRQVRYVLLTHEHGDHAPGSYPWRVATGAQVVAGAEAAYTLQHHLPTGTGYGFHPPQPVDIVIDKDQELDLAGLKVRAIRLPGHTYGSMGWAFTKNDKTWVSIGDLIMPGGTLGYFGSINFSAHDVLQSLRKLAVLKPDYVLGGHGQGDPEKFIAKGIEVGKATGWGKMQPEKPDPLFEFASRNYLVAGWLEPIQAAACGDVDGDGRPDVALIAAASKGVSLKIYLNKGGRFDEKPDAVVELPELDHAFKLRMTHLGGGRAADFLVTSESTALLLISRQEKLDYRIERVGGTRVADIGAGDFNGDGLTDCLMGGRFVRNFQVACQTPPGRFPSTVSYNTADNYFGMELIDVNGDRRSDLVLSSGEVFLRQADGTLPKQASLQLNRPGSGWTFLAVGDFNGDGRPDVVLLSQAPEGDRRVRVGVFYKNGERQRPFASEPNAVFELPLERGLQRDGPTVGDWNGDGVADLVVSGGQETQATILLGRSRDGLDPQRKVVVPLDFNLYHDNRLGVADFNGDGQADLAAFGITRAGAPAVYIWLQPKAERGESGERRAADR